MICFDEPEELRCWEARNGFIYLFDRSGDDPLDTDDGPITPADKIIYVHTFGLTLRVHAVRSTHDFGSQRITTKMSRHLIKAHSFELRLGALPPTRKRNG